MGYLIKKIIVEVYFETENEQEKQTAMLLEPTPLLSNRIFFISIFIQSERIHYKLITENWLLK